MKNKGKIKITEAQKQKMILNNEVTPDNALSKMTVFATRAASKYQLKSLKLTNK